MTKTQRKIYIASIASLSAFQVICSVVDAIAFDVRVFEKAAGNYTIGLIAAISLAVAFSILSYISGRGDFSGNRRFTFMFIFLIFVVVGAIKIGISVESVRMKFKADYTEEILSVGKVTSAADTLVNSYATRTLKVLERNDRNPSEKLIQRATRFIAMSASRDSLAVARQEQERALIKKKHEIASYTEYILAFVLSLAGAGIGLFSGILQGAYLALITKDSAMRADAERQQRQYEYTLKANQQKLEAQRLEVQKKTNLQIFRTKQSGRKGNTKSSKMEELFLKKAKGANISFGEISKILSIPKSTAYKKFGEFKKTMNGSLNV